MVAVLVKYKESQMTHSGLVVFCRDRSQLHELSENFNDQFTLRLTDDHALGHRIPDSFLPLVVPASLVATDEQLDNLVCALARNARLRAV